MKRIGTILPVFAALTAAALPAGTNRFTVEIISRSEAATATNLSRVVWHPTEERATYLRNAGAYTTAYATHFNGFPLPEVRVSSGGLRGTDYRRAD